MVAKAVTSCSYRDVQQGLIPDHIKNPPRYSPCYPRSGGVLIKPLKPLKKREAFNLLLSQQGLKT